MEIISATNSTKYLISRLCCSCPNVSCEKIWPTVLENVPSGSWRIKVKQTYHMVAGSFRMFETKLSYRLTYLWISCITLCSGFVVVRSSFCPIGVFWGLEEVAHVFPFFSHFKTWAFVVGGLVDSVLCWLKEALYLVQLDALFFWITLVRLAGGLSTVFDLTLMSTIFGLISTVFGLITRVLGIFIGFTDWPTIKRFKTTWEPLSAKYQILLGLTCIGIFVDLLSFFNLSWTVRRLSGHMRISHGQLNRCSLLPSGLQRLSPW